MDKWKLLLQIYAAKLAWKHTYSLSGVTSARPGTWAIQYSDPIGKSRKRGSITPA